MGGGGETTGPTTVQCPGLARTFYSSVGVELREGAGERRWRLSCVVRNRASMADWWTVDLGASSVQCTGV